MIWNYFILAWRNLLKYKLFSAINFLGLSSGLACCILMFLFVQHELKYDKFHARSRDLYRLTSVMYSNGGQSKLAVTPAPWAPLMKKDYPEIKNYVRLLKDEKTLIGQPGGEHFYETGMLYADSTFFDVFSVSLDKGDSKHALERPNSIVLTPETARKYFGKADPIGKTLEVNSFGRNLTVEVTAIAQPVPSTSHFHFNSLVSLQTLGDISSLWSFHMFHSYVLLNSGTNPGELEKKFPGFVNQYIINNPQADGKNDIFLQPITDIHLHSNMTGELASNGDITYVYVFGGVAIFILLIACFNFSNLSTARSLSRAKEVGLRKVMGAERQQLLKQFLCETTLFAIFSLIISIALAYAALPLFNQLSGRELTLDFTNNLPLIAMLILMIVAVGMIAGLYPAVVLAAFKPIEVLKGKMMNNNKGLSFRKALVVLQFTVSIGLISCTLLVNQQLRYLRNKSLGFEKDNVIVLSLPRDSDSAKLQNLKNAILHSEGVRSVAASSSVPSATIPINLVNDGGTDLSKAISMQMLFTDYGFAETMHMKLLAGRDLNQEHATDQSEGFLINEEGVKKFGWKNPQNAVGKTIQWVQPNEVLKSGRVVGVVQDFNITPLKTTVQPLVMHYFPQRFQYMYIRFNQGGAERVLPVIDDKFHSLFPKQSIEYTFLDETLNAMYTGERKLAKIFNYFSFLAILIACLGVLGLSLHSIQQRIKEIGIRKVLGASVQGITANLLKEFVKPVLTGAVIATPLAWYVMSQWLKDFAYRIDISITVFVITTVVVLLLAVLTMSIQSIKAALENPVKSLRAE
ncbi:MAG: ABC transporter permease [Flavisolibacter sp.]